MSLPYFPLFPADFEADTSHLTLEEDGAYNRLLRLMWMTPGCSLPDDPAWIARRMRVDMVAFLRIVEPLIAEFMQRKNGRIYSPRLTLEFQKADETYKRRSDAGKKGGRPKAVGKIEEKQKAGLSREKAGPKQPEPEPEIEEREAKASPKKRAVSLPPDWVPSDRNIADASARGFSAKEIDHEADRFRDYHLAKGTTFEDWDAGWRTWLGNARKFGGGRVAGPSFPGGRGQGSSIASIVARRRLAGEN